MTERLPQNYIPINYDLYIHIIKGQNYIDGNVTIDFQQNRDDDKVILNIGQPITINKITQKGSDLKYTIDYPKLIISRLNDEINFKTFPITIFYTIQLKFNPKIKKGIYVYDENYITHLEPIYAREFFPCFDEPCVRSTFSIKVLIPKSLTALSNMPIESTEEIENEKEIKFFQTPPMCSYLLCLCIGTFSSIESLTENGIKIEYFTKSGNEKLFEKYLDAAVFSMNWMESKFKIKFELPALKLISLDGCPPGMENYGLITLPDYSKHQNYIQNISVVMHEVIHQWFGNLVSIKFWNFLWLKEGFAQFIQYLILNDFLPNSEAFRIFAFNDGMRCMDYFDSGVIVPDEADIDYDSLFDTLTYSKGSYVVKMFHDLIGHDNFVNICSIFLNKFKYNSVDLSDFISVVNSTLNEDYSEFFNKWLKKPGFPTLTIREIAQNAGITIVQLKQGETFYKLKVPIIYSKNGEIKNSYVIVSNYITQVVMDFDWILINSGFASLCLVVYSKKLLSCLLKVKNNVNLIDKMMISKAIQLECAPLLIDDEMIEMAEELSSSSQ